MTYSGLAVPVEEMTIEKGGAQLFKAALSAIQVSGLEIALASQPRDQAGVRLTEIPDLGPFLSPAGPVGNVAASILVPNVFPSAQFSSTRMRIRTGP
jgi:hypothetical protein